MTHAMSKLQSDPKDILDPSWLDSYKKQMEAFWWQIVRLNSSMYVLERIAEFRFDVFLEQPHHFWNLVRNALVESCILIIWKIAVDPGPDALGLRQFKNQVFKHIRIENIRMQIAQLFRDGGLDSQLKTLEVKIPDIRHKFIAHLNRDLVTDPTPGQIEQMKLLFSDLAEYRDTVNSYFAVFCFGTARMLVPIEYCSETRHPPGTDSRSDIEQILDGIARQSSILNLPERNHDHWSAIRNAFPHDAIDAVNTYRAKFGLPEK